MRTFLSGIFAGVVLCGVSLAQGTMPAQTRLTRVREFIMFFTSKCGFPS